MEIQFDQLPDLCLRRIFSFLSLRDLARSRTVNRQFKFYVDQTPVTELVVADPRYFGGPRYWFLTGRPIDLKNAISLNAFKSAKSSLFKLDQQLKFLHIRMTSIDSVYKILKGLKQLIHLEVVSRSFVSRETRSLVLPNLKVLVIEGLSLVVLETPKLQFLRCDEIHEIEFEYPKTIKLVDCINNGEHYGDLIEFKNMETLHVHLGSRGVLDGIRLSDLTALKWLHITFDLRWIIGQDLEFVHSVLDLLQEKNDLQRDELRIYLNEVLLVDSKLLRPFENSEKPENAFKFMNYRLLLRDSYPEVTVVDFSQLMRLDFEISEDFFNRFPRIQILTAKGLIDQEQLEWFLQNATAMRALKLTDTRLSQAFFDRLPKLCNRLAWLEFYEISDLIINTQFLLQLEMLEYFKTDRPVYSFDLAVAAFGNSAKLKRLYFKNDDSYVEIERSSALRDDYTMWVHKEDLYTNIPEIIVNEHVRMADLWDCYESIRANHNSPEKRMRIKRARLE